MTPKGPPKGPGQSRQAHGARAESGPALAGLEPVRAPGPQDGFFSPLWRFDDAMGRRPLAGLDEAGRGPLAGPLVAAAVILPPGFDHAAVNDSKKLSGPRREKAFEIVAAGAEAWAFACRTAAEVDRLNPLGASMSAMAEALSKLPLVPAMALVDGDRLPALLPVPARAVVGGDAKSLCVAAASIMAKVIRDRMMMEAHIAHPQYGFDRHKGYGTREHLAALAEHGPCPLHRLSYRGVLPPKPAGPAGPRLF